MELADVDVANRAADVSGWRSVAQRQRLRKLWAKFCTNSTLHGLSDLYNEQQRSLKVFWTLAIIVSCGAAIYGSTVIVLQYLYSPRAVSYTVTHSNAMQLPDVVLCPFTTLSQRFLREHNVSDELANYILGVFGYEPLYSKRFFVAPTHAQGGQNATDFEDQLEALLVRLNMSWQALLDKSSIKCSDVVISCESVTDRTYTCCERAEHQIWSPFGDCIRIRSPMQSLSGFGWGLTLILRPLNEDIVFSGRMSLANRGISLYFVDRDQWEFGDLSFLPQGVHALLAISTVEYDLMDSPESPCSKDGDGKTVFRSTKKCVDLCFFEPAMRKCDCHHLLLGVYVNISRPCTPKEFRECVTPETWKHIAANGDPQKLLELCQRRCPHPCRYKEFQPRMTFANFPSQSIQNFLSEDNTMNNMKDHMVLHVYHEQLVVTKIRQFPSLTEQQFLASIGGQLGLYVGGSILTMVQLVIFLCKWPFVVCGRKERNEFVSYARRQSSGLIQNLVEKKTGL